MKAIVYYARKLQDREQVQEQKKEPKHKQSGERRWEHRVGEALLARGLKELYGLDLSAETRQTGSHGKPYLAAHSQIHYNISHSGQYVVCAFAPQEIGVDIQKHKQVKLERMLGRLVPSEKKDQILSSDNPCQGFFDQWALRESYLKWTGEGFTKNPKDIPLDAGWHVLFSLDPDYSCALWGAQEMVIVLKEVKDF